MSSAVTAVPSMLGPSLRERDASRDELGFGFGESALELAALNSDANAIISGARASRGALADDALHACDR